MNTGHTLPDEQQRQIILHELDKNIMVQAAAGTGKTTSLVGRMKNLLLRGKCKIQNIAAITFTKKASVELKTRFRMILEKEVTETSDPLAREALDNIEKCFIGTIHSFCARLLRERPVEAGVDIPFEEIEPEEDYLLRREVWEEFITGLSADEHYTDELYSLGLHVPDLSEAFCEFTDYPDVHTWPGDDTISALPGMEAVWSRIREYADHMRNLWPRLPRVWNNDGLIPFYREFPRGLDVFDTTIPRDMYELLLLCNKNLKLVQKEWTADHSFTAQESKQEKARWDQFREQVIIPALESFRISRYGLVMRIVKKARAVYDNERRIRGKLNFQDLLMKAASLLRDHPNVRSYFKRKYTHLLIDEFQDTDPVQAQVMMFLTSKSNTEKDWRKCIPRQGSLFVVGDPKQSIYRFRRADIVTYNDVKQMICGGREEKERGILVTLFANFRSTAPVREWVNSTFSRLFPEKETHYSPAYVPLERGRPLSGEDALGALYTITIPEEYCKKNSHAVDYEAARISAFIRSMLDHPGESTGSPFSPPDFLILSRIRKNLHVYANALEAEGIPYAITGGTTLNDIRELRLLTLCLKAVINPDDQAALVGTLRSELFGFSDRLLYDFHAKGGDFCYLHPVKITGDDPINTRFAEVFTTLSTFRGYFHSMPVLSALEKMISDLGLMPLACLGKGGHLKAGGLAKCLDLVRSRRAELWSPSEIVDFLTILINKEITSDSISISGGEGNVVRIMNLHQAKGLEARVVFLADPGGKRKHRPDLHISRGTSAGSPGEKQTKGFMNIQKRGSFYSESLAHPDQWETYQEDEQRFCEKEDIRLLYVAATRAQQILVIVQKERYETRNFWLDFKPFLTSVPELPDHGSCHRPSPPGEAITREDIHNAGKRIGTRISFSLGKTYQVKKAKEYALKEFPQHLLTSPPEQQDTPAEILTPENSGEYGTEWGEIIHRLLEEKMKKTETDLTPLAKSLVLEYEMPPEIADTALELVHAITQSEIWDRARKSSRVLTEIPFQVLLDEKYREKLPVIVRGVVDLIFHEPGCWVLVDYKTDKIENNSAFRQLVARYRQQLSLYADAWTRLTGEKVKEAGLYFTRINTYHICF